MLLAKNTKPKNQFLGYLKTGFLVLKNLRVTRFFSFGRNRVGNPNSRQTDVKLLYEVY
jgi:hypothetical protein